MSKHIDRGSVTRKEGSPYSRPAAATGDDPSVITPGGPRSLLGGRGASSTISGGRITVCPARRCLA